MVLKKMQSCGDGIDFTVLTVIPSIPAAAARLPSRLLASVSTDWIECGDSGGFDFIWLMVIV